MKIRINLTDNQGKEYEGEIELTKIKVTSSRRKTKIKQSIGNKNKPPFPIKQLYNNKFFKKEKKLGDVSTKLKDDGYNFKPGSIQWALDQVEYLGRRGTKGNYKWIQKYPP